ncbi:universal stress protein [Psychrobacter sp. I-STPA6b]|uniref:universal stress protein n=1 Tax=Psychrobacter sp. I-STPA6b TaxID=2585718 RepID=UPI001D0C57CD|nr:universal stress protein [Psychrobacter sp. I-STPA6b]
MNYQHILLVTDLRPDADRVAQKAKSIVDNHNAKLSVLHIVKDTMVGFGYELVPASALYDNVNEDRCSNAKQALSAMLERNGINATQTDVSTAISSSEGIVHYCSKHEVDLLVIGRHERHGISAWINGATVDSILPNIHCDCLVVKLGTPVSK